MIQRLGGILGKEARVVKEQQAPAAVEVTRQAPAVGAARAELTQVRTWESLWAPVAFVEVFEMKNCWGFLVLCSRWLLAVEYLRRTWGSLGDP